MTEKRFTITLGEHNEFKEIIDHSKQDKHISTIEFLKQVSEQDKAFKKLKKENKELKSLCKALITHIEKKSIAFVIDKDIRRLLE